MPIPKPKQGEDKQTFVSRCMGDGVMNREYPDQKQRAGVCYSQWDRKKDTLTGEDLKVRVVGEDILLDYKGMNPAAARILGFTPINDDEILLLDENDKETEQHERDEFDMIQAGATYWEAHRKLQERETEKEITMKYSKAKVRAVKFVDEELGIIEGVAAPFGGPLNGKDLQGEFFTPRTNFCEDWYPTRPIIYHHGMDKDLKTTVVGHDTATKTVDAGRWIQAQLDKSNQYWNQIKQLIKEGRLFFSTSAVPHLVEKAVDGELTVWPWVETSLTVSPANPMAVINSLKAIENLRTIGTSDDLLKRIEIIAEKEAEKMKFTVTCPKCKAEFDYESPGNTDDSPASDTPAPAGDTQPPAENPGVNQGMAPETHVGTEGVETQGQSGQHEGSTQAPLNPDGDKANKGETPKPSATIIEREPEPPVAPTVASDNTAGKAVITSTNAGTSGKTTTVAVIKGPSDSSKAMDDLKLMIEGVRTSQVEALKSVEVAVKEAVKPLEERLKALENAPATDAPITRVINPRNPLNEEKENAKLKALLDDPKTSPDVKRIVGEFLAVDDVSELMRKGPQRIGR